MKTLRVALSFLLLSSGVVFAQWQQSSGTEGRNFQSLLATGNDTFAGGATGAYYSSDSAGSFRPANQGNDSAGPTRSLTTSARHVFSCTSQGVFRTADHGATWVSKSSGLGNLLGSGISFIAPDIFVATPTGVFRSSDEGDTWQSAGLQGRDVRCIAGRPGLILAGTNGNGMFKSTDGGSTWFPVTAGLVAANFRAMEMKGSTFFAAGGIGTGIYRSIDGGTSWVLLTGGLEGAGTFRGFAANAQLIVAAGFGSGVFYSTDNGDHWIKLNDGLGDLTLFDVELTPTHLVAATNTHGVFRYELSNLNLGTSPAERPVITAQPASVSVVSGNTAVFSVTATNSPTSYQWRRNGVSVPAATTGANGATLLLSAATADQAGAYTVVVTNSAGSVTSYSATLTVAVSGEIIRFTNLSALTDITDAVPTFTLGTVALGSGTKPLVVRAAGPSLTPYYGAGTIPDPKVDLLSGQTVVATNDNWQTPAYAGAPNAATVTIAMASVGAFPLEATPALDAAIYAAALPVQGTTGYTVQVSGVNNSKGVVIAEIYDATPASTFTSSTPRLVNVSVLKQVNAGGYITLGFNVGPQGSSLTKTILIRAIGPGLTSIIGSGAMADPQLTLYNQSSQVVIATNDNWAGDVALTKATQAVAPGFVISDTASKDAMLLVTLPPGGYTAEARGVGSSSGLVIVEAYEVP